MIKVSFVIKRGLIHGFTVEGHSGFGEEGNDIVCAAVSSAAYMTVNTITDVLNLRPKIKAKDGFMTIKLSSKQSEKAQVILCGFRLHLTELSKDYNNNLTVTISEV
ncbi:MAG: ribosomal-processing cysteine protease Prp [Clostridia bacterium]|nr:ribosomal-processing cysteine protease Prp [Clostridia bacterium]